jgi:hypothetical protein
LLDRARHNTEDFGGVSIRINAFKPEPFLLDQILQQRVTARHGSFTVHGSSSKLSSRLLQEKDPNISDKLETLDCSMLQTWLYFLFKRLPLRGSGQSRERWEERAL